MTRAQTAALVAILAAILLANPVYVGLLVDEPEGRAPVGYQAVAVDPTDPADQGPIHRVAADNILHIRELTEEGAYNPNGDVYRNRETALATLRQARNTSNVTVTNEAAIFTLNRLDAPYGHVSFGGDDRSYYRLDVHGDESATSVELTAVSRVGIARHALYTDTRLYTSFTDDEREDIDKAINADQTGYHPVDDELRELHDTAIYKNGTHYIVIRRSVTDDFGPSSQDLARIALTLAGVLALLAAITMLLLDRSGD